MIGPFTPREPASRRRAGLVIVTSRMQSLRRSTSSVALVLLLAATAFAVGACGGKTGNDKLLSSTAASRLRTSLDAVQQKVDSGDCEGASAQAQQLAQQASDLPARVDQKFRDALLVSVDRLQNLIATQCNATPATGASGPTEPQTPSQQDGQGQKEQQPGKAKKEKGTKGPPGETPPGQQKKDQNQNGTNNGSTGGTGAGNETGGASP